MGASPHGPPTPAALAGGARTSYRAGGLRRSVQSGFRDHQGLVPLRGWPPLLPALVEGPRPRLDQLGARLLRGGPDDLRLVRRAPACRDARVELIGVLEPRLAVRDPEVEREVSGVHPRSAVDRALVRQLEVHVVALERPVVL